MNRALQHNLNRHSCLNDPHNESYVTRMRGVSNVKSLKKLYRKAMVQDKCMKTRFRLTPMVTLRKPIIKKKHVQLIHGFHENDFD